MALRDFVWVTAENGTGKDLCTIDVRPVGGSAWTQLAQYTGAVSSNVVRPFGRDAKLPEIPVQRHTIRLLVQWAPAKS